MNPIRIAALLILMIVPFTALAQTAGRSGRARSNKAEKSARPGFYFNLYMSDAGAYAKWKDETIKLLQSNGFPAFYGGSMPYKGITFEPFIPVRALVEIKNPPDYKSVWVGPFETEEAAIGELEKFGGVLRPVLRKIKQEAAELKYNDEFRGFDTWSIGAINIAGHQLDKPNSSGEEAAAARDWERFWTDFRAAVQNRDRAALRLLTAFTIQLDREVRPANRHFERFDAGEELWKKLDESIATGAKMGDDKSPRRPTHFTGDESLIFHFDSNGRWRWLGFYKN